MKIKILFVLAAILAFASVAFSQTLVIKSKKTVYTRKGNVEFKEKRNFTVTYLLFNGTMSDAAKKKLENTISYWRVFETTLAENINGDTWLDEASYQVNYNKNSILDISLTQQGSAAYPDSQTVNLVIDLKTGEQVKFADAFKTDALGEFAKMVDKKLKAEVAEQIKVVENDKTNDKETKESLKTQLGELEFTGETFKEYSVSDKGVTILYDAEFPHVIQALQPDGRYFFTWAEAKKFIKPSGLLGKFVR